MRIGILKPDHLGDLVLAAPAVAALRRRFDDPVLIGQPATMALAAHLFPGLRLRPIQLPYLTKGRPVARVPADLRGLRDEIDLLICLRWDRYLAPLVEASGLEFQSSGLDQLDVHVAAEDRAVVAPLAGNYDLLDSFRHPACPPERRPVEPNVVGLCIAAGFVRNAWPLNYWLSLAERFHQQGSRIVLIGGPAEVARLHVLEEALEGSLGYRPRVLVGTSDFGRFLEDVATSVDLVVATDSGTAHLAALVRPVVSLFGGSPWRRYAPLGPFNAVLTREVSCSPCVQFDLTRAQTCHTHECLTRLLPEQVHRGVLAYLANDGQAPLRRIDGVLMARAPWESPSQARTSWQQAVAVKTPAGLSGR